MLERLRYLYRAYRYRRRVDPAEIRFLCERVRPGQTAVDVGAFKGAYTYWMRRSVGASGAVIAFEPQPQQADYLRRMIAAMRWRNVLVEAQGVSDAEGELQLYQPASGHEATFVARKADQQPCQTVTVAVTTLDGFFANRSAGPDFIKIDVEGHESAVLEGARATLVAHRPTLLVECEARHRPDADVRPVFGFLSSFGYEGSFFRAGRRWPLDDFDPDRDQRHEPGCKLPAGYVNNFAFEHPDRR